MPALSSATSAPVPIAMPTVGLRKRRGIVDAVAGHRHEVAAPLQVGNHVALVGRQDLGSHVVDSKAPRDGLGGGPVVAGEHHQAQALFLQPADGIGRRRPNRIRDGDETSDPAVDGDEEHGLTVARAVRRPGR